MTYTSHASTLIGIYEAPSIAEEAGMELQQRGFDMSQVSIAGRDDHAEEHVVSYYTTEEGVGYWGKMGAFWARLHIWWRAGTAFFVIPGIGPTLVAGPLVTSIVNALEGMLVVEGMSVVGAALYSSGIPKDTALRMEAALKSDKFL